MGKGKLDAATLMAYSYVKPTCCRVWLWRVWVGGRRRRQSGVWSQRSLSALTHLSFNVTDWPLGASIMRLVEHWGAAYSIVPVGKVTHQMALRKESFPSLGFVVTWLLSVHRTAWHMCDCEKRDIRVQFTECSVNMRLVRKKICVLGWHVPHTKSSVSQHNCFVNEREGKLRIFWLKQFVPAVVVETN